MEITTICATPRPVLRFLGLLVLLIPASAIAENVSITSSGSPQSLAFARYVASLHQRNPFTESGPVAVEIEASLPALYKQSRLLVIRQTGESERSEYLVLGLEGDATVAQEVIAPYLEVQQQIEDLPLSSLAIIPANYKFRYKGEVGNGGALAYVFEITPKKKRDGLMQGHLWIDSATGVAVLEEGRSIKTPSPFIGRVEVVRETKLVDGCPCARTTHVVIETRRVGRGELAITELPLVAPGEEETPTLPSRQTCRYQPNTIAQP